MTTSGAVTTGSVAVTTGARLHFGPLAAEGSAGGRFGGTGMMVSSPRFTIRAHAAARDDYSGDDVSCGRAADFVRRIRAAMGSGIADTPVRIEIHEAVPSHAGLGSGTQLGLAVAAALSRLAGEQGVCELTLARRVGRGLRSAIGLHGFARGGFLVDGGRRVPGQVGTLVSRIEFPAQWRLILAAPPGTSGLSGAEEQNAFASSPAMPQSLTAELCRITLMEWLPGLIEADFQRASGAMYEFGLGVGRFFEPVQGGVFANSLMSQLCCEVRRRGFPGVAQSSWGPTTCVLCDGEASARQLATDLAADPRFDQCVFRVTEPLNCGARIEQV